MSSHFPVVDLLFSLRTERCVLDGTVGRVPEDVLRSSLGSQTNLAVDQSWWEVFRVVLLLDQLLDVGQVIEILKSRMLRILLF